MPIQESHVITSQQDVWAQLETTFGSPVALDATVVDSAGGGPLKAISTSFGTVEPKEYIDHSRQNLTHSEIFDQVKEYPWTVETNVVPIVSGEYPEIAALLGGVFDSFATGSNTWSFASPNLRPSVQLARAFNGTGDRLLYQRLNGCLVNTMTFRGSGGQKPTLTFGGEAQSLHQVPAAPILSGTAAGGLNFESGLNIGRAFSTGGLVTVDGDDNGGNGYTYTVANDLIDTGSQDWSGLSAGDLVRPFVPDPTYQGTQPIGAFGGSITIHGVVMPVTSFEITVDLGIDFQKDVYGAESMRGGIPSQIQVSGTATVRARQDLLGQLAGLRADVELQGSVEIVMGFGTGRTWTWTMPKVVIPAPQLQSPANGQGTFQLSLMGLSTTATTLDVLTLVHS